MSSAGYMERQMQVALSMLKGIGIDTAHALLERTGGLEGFFRLTDAELASKAGAVAADTFPLAERQRCLQDADAELRFADNSHIYALFHGSDAYPRRLAECPDAPLMLYKLGSCNLDSPHMAAIVGTRHATPHGTDFTRRLVADLAEKIPGLVIVSGLAYGIDIAAHRAAIDAGVPTVAVVAHGLDTIYPATHRQVAAEIVRKGGAIVTEYPSGTKIMKPYFLARNRIIAGLCDCTIVIESARHGGSLSTARLASLYHREVFAVPGRPADPYSIGTNRLIADNAAALLSDADSLAKAMQWECAKKADDAPPRLFVPLPPDEQRLLDIIAANPAFTVNDITAASGMPYARVADILFKMELDDIIIAIPGGRYAPANYNKV